MVGVGTVLADDPALTCRLPGYRANPVVRVVADSHLRTPLTATLVATAAEAPTWMLIRKGTDRERRHAFADLGVTLIEVAGAETGVDPVGALAALGDAGITQVLVEGGAQLAASLLRADLVDRIAWFHAPAVMGGDAWPAVQAFGIERLDAMPRFTRVGETPLGDDMLTRVRQEGGIVVTLRSTCMRMSGEGVGPPRSTPSPQPPPARGGGVCAHRSTRVTRWSPECSPASSPLSAPSAPSPPWATARTCG